ncbi:MAG: efflux RND transporter periplasmic adaptor subunit [Pararhodobacter sp.]|nr:efflux RND transporter periplasmic adaptor subunit [Pararhodobacter sp.]
MRLVPLLTAAIVVVTLYMIVMERETLYALAGVAPGQEIVAEPEEAPEPRLRVVVQRFEIRDIESVVVLRGRTQLARTVEMLAETSGRVISEPLARGSSVSEGDVLCELDPGTRRASLAEAEARLAEAEINFTAATRLSEGGFAAQTRVVSAEAAVRAAEAGVEAARAELERLQIRAPFDGILEAESAERGSLLSPGGRCATVLRLDPIILVGHAAETQIDRLESGALAGARLSNGEEVVGQVSFVSRSADPATRTFRVEVTVPNPDLRIRDGVSADILIAAQATRGHLVPGSALTLNDEGLLGLRVLDEDERVGFKPVTVLRDSPQGFWVSGLPESVDVIVVGHEYVRDGARVEAVRRENGNGEAAVEGPAASQAIGEAIGEAGETAPPGAGESEE